VLESRRSARAKQLSASTKDFPMIKDTDLLLAICAFALYIVGGLATFAGLGLYFFIGGKTFSDGAPAKASATFSSASGCACRFSACSSCASSAIARRAETAFHLRTQSIKRGRAVRARPLFMA